MDLGTDYCSEGVPLALCWSLARVAWIYISGINWLLSPSHLLTEGGRSRSIRQAITPASYKEDNCYK